MPRKTFPSFTFVLLSHREFLALSDYHAKRYKQYELLYQEVDSQDLMKTIDYPGLEYPEAGHSEDLLPDSVEDEGKVMSHPDHSNVGHERDIQGHHLEVLQPVKKMECRRWILRVISIAIQPHRWKTRVTKNAR